MMTYRTRQGLPRPLIAAARLTAWFFASSVVVLGVSSCGRNDLTLEPNDNGPDTGGCGDGYFDPGEQCDEGDDNGPGGSCLEDCTLNVCGDGFLGPEEECDLGAENSDNGVCKSDCTDNVCGDGFVGPGEGCDDGNDINDDACTNACTLPICGDDILQPQEGEQCDDGDADNSDECTTECTLATCGDGYIQPFNGEECDDGNLIGGDGCSATCAQEVCGNGVLDPGEECDFGDANSNQGECKLDCTYNVCGDGFEGPDEECDLGDENSNQGECKLDCTDNVCGDGFVGPDEECDLGAENSDNGACKSDCTDNVCGDGFIGPGEGCDDGNNINDDECSNDCEPWSCGDSIVQFDEECDDGNDINDDTCTNACTLPTCGDQIVQPLEGEECDDGNPDNTDECTTECAAAACGDTYLQPVNNEECDDGNLDAGDGCSPVCGIEECGNSIVDFGEDCDDGQNGDQDDGCTDLCALPTCGDMWIQPSLSEVCDDGNLVQGDGCNNDCQLSAQTLWTDTYDHELGNDQALAVDTDSAANIAIAGRVVSGTTVSALVRKYDPDGGLIWERIENAGMGNDYGYGVAVDTQDNVIAAGRVTVTGEGGNVWVRKYDSQGNELWTRTFDGGAGSTDEANAVAAGPDDTLVVVGRSWTAVTSYDIWVRKYDADGGVLWTRTHDEQQGDDTARGVAIDQNSGAVAVVGQVWRAGVGSDIWVRKYTADGSEQWTQSANGDDSNDTARGVAINESGDIVVTGNVWVQDEAANVWVRAYDTDGNTQWTETFNNMADNSNDAGRGVDIDSSGAIIVAGSSWVAGHSYDIWVRRYTPLGATMWTRLVDGPADNADYGRGVSADINDDVVVCGQITVTGESSNLWLRKYSP
jgi:cysteine-rich repeat protein